MPKLETQLFIEEQHKDWERILSESPYCLDIRRDKIFGKNLILLKYNQQNDPDFSLKLVRECRGLILDEDTLEIVSYPFNKFGNHGEGDWVDEINWNSTHVTTKIDGSIIKIVKLENDELLISTNGCIDAFKCDVSQNQPNCPYRFYGDIVKDILLKKFKSLENFKSKVSTGYTYVFEMISPFTKVVIPYSETDLYLIGCRNNITLEETYFKDCPLAQYFKTPEVHSLKTIDDCLKMTEKMPWDEEGYVVVDADFHRIKIKSLAYLAVHRLANNGIITYERALELIRTNEIEEVLTYFPEHKKTIEFLKEKTKNLEDKLENSWKELKSLLTDSNPSRKDSALWIQKNFEIPGCGFAFLDGKIKTAKEWLDKLPTKNLVKYLKLKPSNED